MRVLDLGCGNGRVAEHLAGAGALVWACDLNVGALEDWLRTEPPPGATLVLARDARALPFAGGSFHAVVFACNGLDFLASEEERLAALREVERVLAPGGLFLFSSHNRLGSVLSPRGLRSRELWRWRVRHALPSGGPFVEDAGGTALDHAAPGNVIRQVEAVTGLCLVEVRATRSGVRGRPLAALLSAWPTYVFRNPG